MQKLVNKKQKKATKEKQSICEVVVLILAFVSFVSSQLSWSLSIIIFDISCNNLTSNKTKKSFKKIKQKKMTK